MSAMTDRQRGHSLVVGSDGLGVPCARLITPPMKAAADKAAEDIKAGSIKVHDYMSDSKCPV